MNITYFTEYNYELMTDPDYKEDTVREEIIAPLINLLGYSVGSENKIIRSKPLKHPFLTVGSNSRKVTYIPDYLLEVKNIKVLVLDAKAPNENIISGKNVEQAYSYAIHPERGCGQKVGLFYDARPRLRRYSRGLMPPKDILIRFSLYQ